MTDPIPEGCEGLIPHLVLKGAADALAFYKKAFGAEEITRHLTPDGRIMHAEMRIGQSVVYLADDFPEFCGGHERSPSALGGSSINVHRYVTDCDAAVKRAADAGATVTMPPADMFWGDRYGVVTDPHGHVWSFATHVKDVTPEEMEAAAAAAFGG